MPLIKQKQRSFSVKTEFTYGDDDLKYSIEDSSGSESFTVNYASVPAESQNIKIDKNPWFRNAGVLCLIIGIVQGLFLISDPDHIRTSIWIISGAVLFAIHAIAKTKYTVLNCDQGNTIFLIRNKSHDKIYDEIKRRRKIQVLGWYGEINFENEPSDEITKFVWLHDQGYISEDKLKSIVEKITDYHNNKISESVSEDENGGKTIN